MPVPRLAATDDPAAGHVQRGKERGRTVAGIVVGVTFRVAQAQRQRRLGPFQCLALTLLIEGEHQRLLGRGQVQADDIDHFFHEVRVGGELEVLVPVRQELEAFPEPLDRGLGDAVCQREAAATPVGANLIDLQLSKDGRWEG